MESLDGLQPWLRLTLTPGVGDQTARRLLSAFGLPERLFSSPRSVVSGLIGPRLTSALFDSNLDAVIDKSLAWAAQPGNHLLTLADSNYPPMLLELPDPPTVLYVCGNPALLNADGLAIVGSRNATPQGQLNARQFAKALAAAGLNIISGLALGIDAAAHEGALEVGGKTIAVVGTGLDRVYPARHRDLAHQIAAQGAIVSEFPLGTPPLAGNFPRRNRLIAGLSRGTLVVEAAPESGSLITARLAAEQGREVFAIPGSIHSPVARGCHRLIRQGAKLVETTTDILEDLRWYPGAATEASLVKASQTTPDTPPDQTALLQHLGHDPATIDQLLQRSGLTTEGLSVILLQLELEGSIACLPGGRYQRVA